MNFTKSIGNLRLSIKIKDIMQIVIRDKAQLTLYELKNLNRFIFKKLTTILKKVRREIPKMMVNANLRICLMLIMRLI